MTDFDQAAKAAGFTGEQVSFMMEWLALNGHHHDIEEIDGLEEALEVEDDEEEDEE